MIKKLVSRILVIFFEYTSKNSGPNAFYINKIISDANFSIGKGSGGPNSIVSEINSVGQILDTQNPKLIIDVGAHQGSYTDLIIEKYPNSIVHCFEPSKHNFNLLSKKYAEKKNIHLNNMGLSDSEGDVSLFSDFSGSGLASLNKRKLNHFNKEFDYKEKVKTITFDKYWSENLQKKEIDLFKIDVEGAELSVLQGCKNTMENIKNIQFEFGGANIDSRTYFQDFWYLFKEYNYEIFRITPFGLIEINTYTEQEEFFKTTNYIARNKNML